jgi:hypothetical protein
MMKGLIDHPTVWENLCGTLKVPIGFPKFPMEFLGDFIQCEVLRALPEGKRSQNLGQHRNL